MTCYGAVEFDIDMESGNCTLFGAVEEAAFNQSVSIVIKDEEAKEVHVSYAKTDNDGSFTYTFKFGNLPSGEYEASIGAYGISSPIVLEKIYYASVADRAQALETINSAAEQYKDKTISKDMAINEVLSAVESYARVLEVENKLYSGCGSEIKKKLAELALESAPFESVADFRDLFNAEFAVLMLCGADSSDMTEIIEEMWDEFGFEESSTFSLFSKLEDKTPVYERMAGGAYKTVEDVLDCFEKSVLLELLYKAENIADAKSVYDDFADILGFSYSDYPKWTTRDMAVASRKKYFKDVDELTDALDEAYDNKKTTQSGGGSSGGGGGSSSSKGSSGVSMVPTPSVVVTEEKKPIFNDMQSALWANDAVEALYVKGIISGNNIGGFEPARNISREEFVKIIVNAFSLNDENASCNFTDVPRDRWSYPYVATAASKGIVNGVGDNFFNATGSITRQDMAVIVKRVIDFVNKNFEEPRKYTEFSDSSEIADYAKDAVLYLYKSGILNGFEDGSFKPQSTATRAEAAYLIYKIIS